MDATICEVCGATIVNQWPWCPHGALNAAPSVQTDDLIGGFVQEHFGNEPEYFTSKKAMRQRADELGLRPVDSGDRHRGRYGVTAKTLEDAKALLTRGSQTVEEIQCDTVTTTVRVIR